MPSVESVILIGMPGAGKSTVGVILAKALAKDFVDTDVLIQVREGKTLQEIIDESDYLNLREIEAQVLAESNLPSHVIATGGSAVYSDKAMQHLRSFGPTVYLDVSLEELRRRIHNYESRGIARRLDQSFEEVFDERSKLYRKYADLTVDCNGKTQAEVLSEVEAGLERLGGGAAS